MNTNPFCLILRLLFMVWLSLFLEACDERDQETTAVDPDIELMKNAVTAGPELERRLLDDVSVRGGLIVVHTPLSTDDNTYVLPRAPRKIATTANLCESES
jgi:hypothetical protein